MISHHVKSPICYVQSEPPARHTNCCQKLDDRGFKAKVYLFDWLWICCKTSWQQAVGFSGNAADMLYGLSICCRFVVDLYVSYVIGLCDPFIASLSWPILWLDAELEQVQNKSKSKINCFDLLWICCGFCCGFCCTACCTTTQTNNWSLSFSLAASTARNHVFKVGVQFLGLGYYTEQNMDGIPSFVHCSVLRNGNHTLH